MRGRLAPTITLCAALLTALVLAVAPAIESSSCTATGSRPSVCTTSTGTLVEHEGASVIVVLLVPAALAAVGVVAPHRRVLMGLAVVLTTLAMLGAASIGLLFLPTVAAAWVAATRSRRTSSRRPGTATAA